MWDLFKHILLKTFIKTYYFSLSILLLFCTAISYGCLANYFDESMCNAWVKDFFLNLIAEIVGILLVLFFVNRSVTLNQDVERKKFTSIALRQLKLVLQKQVYLLFNMFKASVEFKPSNNYETLKDLFDDTYFQEVGFLDLMKVSPGFNHSGVQMDWIDYLFSEFSSFKLALSKVVDRYSFHLDSEVVDLLEELNDSGLIYFVSALKEAKECNDFELRGDLLSECEPLLREYTTLFLQLLDLYNKSVTIKNEIKLDSSKWNELWGDNIIPQVGSSRIQFYSES